MSKIKLLIFGSKGWIGNQFLDYLRNINDPNINYLETNIRADNEKLVNDIILAHSPTHIISFIGRINGEGINNIDYLEKPGKLKENVRDNLYAPLVLSHMAKKYNIHYTYIGTGCIYNSDDPTKNEYLETDDPNFFGSSYSTVKGFTDRLMRLLGDTTLNLRIRMPIVDYEHPRNFITKIVKYEKICSNPNSLTILSDFYPIILDMIKNDTIGTFNLVNPGLMSHNEILEMYKEIIDPEFKWINFSIEEQDNVLKSKRSNNHLSTKKIENLYPELLDIKQSMRNCLIRMKTNSYLE